VTLFSSSLDSEGKRLCSTFAFKGHSYRNFPGLFPISRDSINLLSNVLKIASFIQETTMSIGILTNENRICLFVPFFFPNNIFLTVIPISD